MIESVGSIESQSWQKTFVLLLKYFINSQQSTALKQLQSGNNWLASIYA
jgi:hypothetical protein